MPQTAALGFSAQAVKKSFREAVEADKDSYLNFNTHATVLAYTHFIKQQPLPPTIGRIDKNYRKVKLNWVYIYNNPHLLKIDMRGHLGQHKPNSMFGGSNTGLSFYFLAICFC